MRHSDNLKLFTTPISANGRKVLALAYHLKLNIDIQLIDVYKGEGQSPDYLKLNPFGKVPTLVEGGFILWESNAILQYIAEAYAEHEFYPKDTKLRADIARWLFWETAHWQPAVTTVLSSVVGHALLPELVPVPNGSPNWGEQEFARCLGYLDAHLEKNHFLVMNRLSIADFAVAGMMTYFRFAGFPFEKISGLAKWYERIEALEAWKKTEAAPWKK